MDHLSKVSTHPQRPRRHRRKPVRGRVIRGLFLAALCYSVPALWLKLSWFQEPAFITTQGFHQNSVGGAIAPFPAVGTGTTLAQVTPQAVVLITNSRLRSRPSGGGRISGQGQAGDRGTLIDQQPGDDGNLWYFVQFTSQQRQGWVPANQVTRDTAAAPGANPPGAGGVEPNPQASLPQPNPTQPPATADPELSLPRRLFGRARQAFGLGNPPPGPSPVNPRPSPPTVESVTVRPGNGTQNPPDPNLTSQDVLLYFYEVALGSEWGSGNEVVRRWNQDLRIQVFGNPTPEDSATLRTVANELNELLQGQVQLQFVERDPNVEIFFAPESQFQQLDSNYRPRNLGFFWTRWNYSGINSARILISTTGVTQTERSHLIREELTQSLGLMRDSYRYPDSMFYQGWTEVTRYSDIDRAIIQLLYQDGIRPGMTRDEVVQFLSRQQHLSR